MEPVVSVIFITYNHEKYVEKSLRSVLEQETDFPFEVVVGEDCSKDRTREIVQRVAAEYPQHEVRFLFRKENLGRPTLNVYETTMECRGEFLAYLEGDDYWTDRKKLQKQVDFLRAHREYIGVTHKSALIDENDEANRDPEALRALSLYDWTGPFTYQDYKYTGKWPGHFASLLSRNIYHNGKLDYTILYRAHDFVDDAVILLFLLLQGDLFRLDEEMAVWRFVKKKESGSWTSVAAQRDIAKDDCYLSKTLMQWIEENAQLDEYAPVVAKRSFNLALSRFLKKPVKKNRQFLKDMYDYQITHVVMHDQKSSLFSYSCRAILEKITGK